MNLWRQLLEKGISFAWSFAWTGGEKRVVKDLFLLLDAIHLPFGRPEYFPLNGTTHCNQYVAEVCEIYGYKGLSGLVANQIIDLISQSPSWSEVPIERVQELANGGSLIILGIKGDVHGHVNIGCPGKPKTSGRFGSVPSVANVGKENWLGRGCNWAFSELPKAYAWRTSL